MTRSSSAATTVTSPRSTQCVAGPRCEYDHLRAGAPVNWPKSSEREEALTSPGPTTSTLRPALTPTPDTDRRAACHRGAVGQAGARRQSLAPLNLRQSMPEPQSGHARQPVRKGFLPRTLRPCLSWLGAARAQRFVIPELHRWNRPGHHPLGYGRAVCSLGPWPSPITTGTAKRYVRGVQSGGLSDPAAGAGELDRFVAVGGAELGGCRGEGVADCAGGQGRAFRDFIDGGAACREFQDVSFAGGERAVAGADGVGGEFGVDVAAATVDGAYHVGQDLGRDGLGQEPADAGRD